MTGDFTRLARRYGRAAALRENGGETVGMVFLQPLREKEERLAPTPLGRREQGRFLCLGEPGLGLDGAGEGARLSCGGEDYDIVTARPVRLGERVLFTWAVLTPRDREAAE